MTEPYWQARLKPRPERTIYDVLENAIASISSDENALIVGLDREMYAVVRIRKSPVPLFMEVNPEAMCRAFQAIHKEIPFDPTRFNHYFTTDRILEEYHRACRELGVTP